MARTIPAPTSTRTRPTPPPTGGGVATGHKDWVALDLTPSKWAALGDNTTNNWVASNDGAGNLVITCGIEDPRQQRCLNNGGQSSSVGTKICNGLALVYKDHLDCTPDGAPAGVTADTFYSEYAVVAVRMQFGQIGTASSGCGYGIGGDQADDSDPWGTSASRGSSTRAGIGFSCFNVDQSSNPLYLPDGGGVGGTHGLNRFAYSCRTKKLASEDGASDIEFMTLCPNDGATGPNDKVTLTAASGSGPWKYDDYNFNNQGEVELREGTSDTDGYDTIVMQMGGYPSVPVANQGDNTNDVNDGSSIRSWVANSGNTALTFLPVNATGPVVEDDATEGSLQWKGNHLRFSGAYMHPMILIDQATNVTYDAPEKVHVVIKAIEVLVQPIRGRLEFP